MHETCQQHHNKIERICLHPDCQERALCLLCDHPHGNPFRSIMVKTSESYKTFESVINLAIDRHLLQQQENLEHKVQVEQANLLRKYFSDLRQQFEHFLGDMEAAVLKKIQSEDEENFSTIKRARINKNYVDVPSNIFQILRLIYEGMPFEEIFRQNESGKTEQAYHFSLQLHNQIKEILEDRNCKLKTKLPDIRQVLFRQNNQKIAENDTVYDTDAPKPKYAVKLVKQSSLNFESVISDCQRIKEFYIATSYDKTIKIIDNQLQLKAEYEYNNILTKIQQIAENVFAIGHSKEVAIQNIRFEKNQLRVENIMKLRGHTEKINDIHCLNTRIIGSSSLEGVKLWDLYKEKCQYTLKDQANPTSIRFLPSSNTLVVGYNNHTLKLFSIQTMKLIKKYELSGVPLLIDQGKFTQHQFYIGGFPSILAILDTRLHKMASEFNFKQGAITSIADSLNDQTVVATGDRDGNCNIFDLRTKKVRIGWQAHSFKTNISKPRGIVNIFQSSETSWTTIGCNDKSFKLWQIENIHKQY